jgi:hypothetical protein
MENIKKMFVVASLTVVLMFGSTVAYGGILVNGFNDKAGSQQCTEQGKINEGIILSDYKGILVNGFTGILVNGFTGILVNGFTGILVNDLSKESVNCRVLAKD